jgi:hypothetical protein
MTSTDPNQPPIYVLDGIAGIGKSTVAQTIAMHSAELGYLGASFFFSKADDERKSARLFFSTLAYQLSRYDEIFARRIGGALEHAPDAPSKTLGQQLQLLLVGPLHELSRTQPTLLVIDALDECEETDAIQVLALLASKVKDLPKFKILVTTRPEPHLHTFFTHQGLHHKSFHLHDIEAHIVEADIHLYLTNKLCKEQVQKALPNFKEEWEPTLAEFKELENIVGKLFVIAATAIRFILDKRMGDPKSQMKKLINAFQEGTKLNAMAILDKMYLEVLQSAVPKDSEIELVSHFQKVMGTIIVLENPLPLKSLASLLGTTEERVTTALSFLHSIIVLGSNDQAPQVYHKSFPDFITDETRCTDSNLYISSNKHHAQVALYCFKVMRQKLHTNMYDLDRQQMHFSKNDIDRLHKESIKGEVIYACLHWATHLSKAEDESKSILLDELKTFAFKHLLHWMEVLSLSGNMDIAHPALLLAQNYVVSQALTTRTSKY